MIYIVSAGRSGSAWLTAVLEACGLDCTHEMYPTGHREGRDCLADTSWIWTGNQLTNRLKLQNALGAADTVILLERPREEIERSVAKLLGKKEDWDRLFAEWEKLKASIWTSGLTQILKSGFRVQYKDMFQPQFKDTLRAVLSSSGHADKMHNVDRVWELFRHLRVTNKTAETECAASHQLSIRN